MEEYINNDWKEILKEEFSKEYFITLKNKLNNEYLIKTIYPQKEEIFNALNYTKYNEVKVVIVGQDPYHGEGEAHGLSFSVKPGIKTPQSLKNIYKELHEELGCFIPNNGYLKKWADQGVLMLNTVLTVEKDKAYSHSKLGWQFFTDMILEKLNERNEPIVFLLWGNYAKSKKRLITNCKHKVLEAAHPSPLSAYNGFFGCNHFKETNIFLRENGYDAIDWQIEDI